MTPMNETCSTQEAQVQPLPRRPFLGDLRSRALEPGSTLWTALEAVDWRQVDEILASLGWSIGQADNEIRQRFLAARTREEETKRAIANAKRDLLWWQNRVQKLGSSFQRLEAWEIELASRQKREGISAATARVAKWTRELEAIQRELASLSSRRGKIIKYRRGLGELDCSLLWTGGIGPRLPDPRESASS